MAGLKQAPLQRFILINRNGPFLHPQSSRGPDGRMRNFLHLWNQRLGVNHDVERLRLTVLLHELGHITGALPPDAGDPALVRRNTLQVIRRCID